MLLSLIQTSQNRGKELARFVDSLNRQTNVDFSAIQLIFVDQGDNKNAFDTLDKRIKLTYLRTNRCSLSRARNFGLKYVEGDFVGFPDDDCWYKESTLSQVLALLSLGAYQGVAGKGMSEDNVVTGHFLSKQTELSVKTYFSAISYTMFFKYDKDVLFDENIGIGSPYNIGSGEESDYMLFLMSKKNYRILYSPEIIVHHPSQTIYEEQILLKKSYSYARGAGYLARKHNFPLKMKISLLIKPLMGLFYFSLTLNLLRFKKSFLLLKGRIEGLFFKVGR